MLTLVDKDKEKTVVVADVLVFALGSTHLRTRGGIPEIIDAPLHEKLHAYYDHNRAISDNACLLAIGTEDRSLMIVGASMHSQAGFTALSGMSVRHPRYEPALNQLSSYAELNQTLPPAARPPEGIAMVMAGIEALNGFMPVTASTAIPNEYDQRWDINFNTSNRTQLGAYLAHTTDLEPYAANLAVALIVWLRTAIPLGLSDPQVATIISVAQFWTERYRLDNPGMNDMRLAMQQRYGQDLFLDIQLRVLTSDEPAWQFWRRYSIHYPPVF